MCVKLVKVESVRLEADRKNGSLDGLGYHGALS